MSKTEKPNRLPSLTDMALRPEPIWNIVHDGRCFSHRCLATHPDNRRHLPDIWFEGSRNPGITHLEFEGMGYGYEDDDDWAGGPEPTRMRELFDWEDDVGEWVGEIETRRFCAQCERVIHRGLYCSTTCLVRARKARVGVFASARAAYDPIEPIDWYAKAQAEWGEIAKLLA